MITSGQEVRFVSEEHGDITELVYECLSEEFNSNMEASKIRQSLNSRKEVSSDCVFGEHTACLDVGLYFGILRKYGRDALHDKDFLKYVGKWHPNAIPKTVKPSGVVHMPGIGLPFLKRA